MTGEEVVRAARGWLGTKWQHQASKKGVGCDCIGLIRGVARDVGIEDPFQTGRAHRYAGYGRQPNPVLLYQACAEFMDPVFPAARAVPGDVLVLRFEEDPMHFAFLSGVEPRYIIHAFARFPRRVVEHRLDDTWATRVLCAYRLRDAA